MTRPLLTGYSPRRIWRSVPQIVVSVMRIYRFADSGAWTLNFLDANVVHAMENSGPHLTTSGRSP
jgi:hypothetical protein